MALLDVEVLHTRDLAGALEGGADRLTLVGLGEHGSRSPELPLAASVIRGSDVPVRVLLRPNDGYSCSGGEFTKLIQLAQEVLSLGAAGVVFGFLDADLEVDTDTTIALAQALPDVPWTFHRAIDATLSPARSWRKLLQLPGLTAVQSGGSPQGLDQGYDDLVALAESDPAIARLLEPSGGLRPDQVPWFSRAGVTQFQVGLQVRPGATFRSYVDPDFVRSWRRLLDATDRAATPSAG